MTLEFYTQEISQEMFHGPLRNITIKSQLNYMQRIVRKYGTFSNTTVPLNKIEPYLLAGNVVNLEIAANDLLFWYANKNTQRFPERMARLESRLHSDDSDNPSTKVADPAQKLSEQLKLGSYEDVLGLNGYEAQAREVLKLIDISNVALRMYGVHKEYKKARKNPLMIRANQ